MMHKIPDPWKRRQQLVTDYTSKPVETRSKALVLCGTNAERLALTAALRTALQADGSLGTDTFTLRSLQALDRTKARLKYAAGYNEEEVVVPVRDYRRYGLEKNAQYTVTERDVEHNLIIFVGPEGKTIRFDPSRCADKTTYAVQEIEIAPGDQLRWTRNGKSKGMRNGQLVNVAAIDPNGMATLEDADGQATTDEIRKVGSILLQGPVAQQLKRGRERKPECSAMAVLMKAQKVVEKAQLVKQTPHRHRGQGIER